MTCSNTLTKTVKKEFLFAVDIEKAFTFVDHSFIFATLKRFWFGDSFVPN